MIMVKVLDQLEIKDWIFSTGNWIMFADADDNFPLFNDEKLFLDIDKNNCDIIYFYIDSKYEKSGITANRHIWYNDFIVPI